MLSIEDINRSVAKARDGKNVSVKKHLGAGWFLSLTPGISCVDLRKFFQHRDNSIRPSRLGTALTYGEWDALMNAAATINSDFDGFKACLPCWHATDEQLEKVLRMHSIQVVKSCSKRRRHCSCNCAMSPVTDC